MISMKGVAAALLLAYGILAEITKDNGVLVLTDANFEEALSSHPGGLLVEMYAPWCGHCKQLAPEYEKAAKELEGHGLSIAKLDATEHTEAAANFEVQGFPTLKYIVGGIGVDYNGGRTADDIVKYVIKKSGPPAVPLDSEKSIAEFASGSEVVIVGFFSDSSSPAAKSFIDVANIKDNFPFGIVTDPAVIKNVGASPNSVQILKTFDEKMSELPVTDETSAAEISTFIDVYSMHLVTKFTPESARAIFYGAVNIHAIFFTEELEGDLLESATESAKKYRGQMIHVHVGLNEPRVAEYFGISEEDYPTVVISDMNGNVRNYLIGETPLTTENILKFADDYFAGNLVPHLKSEEPAESDLANTVKIVKGKSFESIVLENNDNVFVMFHAPWCGHCNALAPTWEELGETMKGTEGIVIGKMDATANEVDQPGIIIESFPTLIFFPAGEKDAPVVYDGERELADLKNFIEERSKYPTKSSEDLKDEL